MVNIYVEKIRESEIFGDEWTRRKFIKSAVLASGCTASASLVAISKKGEASPVATAVAIFVGVAVAVISHIIIKGIDDVSEGELEGVASNDSNGQINVTINISGGQVIMFSPEAGHTITYNATECIHCAACEGGAHDLEELPELCPADCIKCD